MNQNLLFTSAENMPFQVEVRSDGTTSIRGYAAVFYDKDRSDMTQYMLGEMYAERIFPGSFRDIIDQKQDVRALFNHNPDMVLGRTKNGTLTFGEDANGLAYQILPPSTQIASDVIALMKRGDISGSSFSFTLPHDDAGGGGAIYRTDGNLKVREIYRFKSVHDMGPVTFPAYRGTTAMCRSESPEEVQKWFAVQEAKREQAQKRAAKIEEIMANMKK